MKNTFIDMEKGRVELTLDVDNPVSENDKMFLELHNLEDESFENNLLNQLITNFSNSYNIFMYQKNIEGLKPIVIEENFKRIINKCKT